MSLYTWLRNCMPGGQHNTKERWERLNEAFGEGWKKECVHYLGIGRGFQPGNKFGVSKRDEAMWEVILEMLEFMRVNGRFPKGRNGDKNERRLYYWLHDNANTTSNYWTRARHDKLIAALGAGSPSASPAGEPTSPSTTGGSCSKQKKKAKRHVVDRRKLPKDAIVIGLDPGRVNIFYAVRIKDGRIFKLTRSEYYHLSGINHRKFAMAKLGQGLEDYHRQLSREGSLKTADRAQLIRGLQLRVQYYEQAWAVYGADLTRAKLAFNVHCGKMRTLQQKFNDFGTGLTREEKKRIVVGYGDGKFPSHGPRGERAVPVTRTRRICGRTWHTVDANESYSTVTCNDCEGRLLSVRTDIPYYDRSGRIRFKENRGCKHCKSDTCRSEFPFKGRDHNAALNIGRITICMLRGDPRPRCYTKAYHDNEIRRARRGRPAS